jgi:hypothetical protein
MNTLELVNQIIEVTAMSLELKYYDFKTSKKATIYISLEEYSND